MTDNNQRVNEQAERELLMRFVAIITGATSLGENRVYDLAEALISVAHAAIEQAAPEAPAAASVKPYPDQAAFEEQARYQGATNFTLVHPDFLVCNNGWSPATYRDPMTELAWRMWANKLHAQQVGDTILDGIVRYEEYGNESGGGLQEAADGDFVRLQDIAHLIGAAPAAGTVEKDEIPAFAGTIRPAPGQEGTGS